MVDITQVNADDTVKTDQDNNTAFGTDLALVNRLTITDANGRAVDTTNLVPSATQVLFDFGDMIANNQKFGAAQIEAFEAVFEFLVTGAGEELITGDGENLIAV